MSYAAHLLQVIIIPSRSFFGSLMIAMLAVTFQASRLSAQNQSPQQMLATMEVCRDQVISKLSFSDKMKMKAAMSAIENKPELVEANNGVKNAPALESQIEARKALATVKLDLIARQDPSLKPIVDKIRVAQASVLK